MATTLESLNASFDKILSLEQQTSSARSTVHEALANLLQSRSELSSTGAMLSAATRSAMGKRGVAQLEATKGLLDMAYDTAAVVRADATKLREEVYTALKVRDEALQKAEAAEEAQQQSLARVEADSAAQLVARNEIVDRAERAAEAATSRAEAAELRAEQAERAFTEAERSRVSAAAALEEASTSKEEAERQLTTVAAQLTREREVLAKVMAENVTFVKKLQFAENERERAVEELDALRTAWRQQTEGWFASAAEEMQAKLLQDWGAANQLLTELTKVKHERETSDRVHTSRIDELGSAEGDARRRIAELEAEGEGREAELRGLRAQLEKISAQLDATVSESKQFEAQAEVVGQQLEKLQHAEATWRERGEADMAERLALRAAHEDAMRDKASLEQKLDAAEEKARLMRAVNERVRAESSEEHGKLLEAQAKLDQLEHAYNLLSRQNSVLIRSAEAVPVG